MIFEITYSFLFFLAVFFSLRYIKLFQIEGLKKWDLAFVFGLKSFAGLFFIYIFTWHYGPGYLYYDSSVYISDAKILQSVFSYSPINFLKLLSGIGETKELIETHLQNTHIWSQPNKIIHDDAKNIIRINSVIHFFSFGQIYIHFIVFNLFSIFGIVQIYLYFKKYIKINHRLFLFGLVILPSFLFWGSGVLKEPMVIFVYGLLFWILRKPFEKKYLNYLSFLIIIYLLLNFKAYILVAIIFPFSFIIFSKYIFPKMRLYYVLGIQFMLLFTSFLFMPNQWQVFVDNITDKQFDFNNITKGGIYLSTGSKKYDYQVPINQYDKIVKESDSVIFIKDVEIFQLLKGKRHGLKKITMKADSLHKFKIKSIYRYSNSYIEPTLILYSKKQLIKNIPISLVNSLLRPSWNDPSPKFKFLTILETYILFAFLILAFIFRRKLNRNEQIMIITLALFVIILSLFIGWTTTVFGAIVRYRIFSYLIILIISFILIKPFKEWKTKKNIS
ncbi:MAG: hypothetical protein V4622_05215 [Bacteroidota bacterium]